MINKIYVDATGLDELLKRLDVLTSIEVRRAQASALNKGGGMVRTASVKGVASSLKIKQKLIRPKIKVKRATAKKMGTRVWANTQGVPLINLKPKSVDGGIQAGQWLVPQGFIATPTKTPKQPHPKRRAPSSGLIGKDQVFFRKTKDSYPLDASKVNIHQEMRQYMTSRAKQFMRNDLRRVLQEEYKFRVLRKAGVI